ncbi:hypothetical protein K1719_015310 [Acacia pycnantha]|nr:hypothetical protein K1719_015310 [Acacia pycnantha]
MLAGAAELLLPIKKLEYSMCGLLESQVCNQEMWIIVSNSVAIGILGRSRHRSRGPPLTWIQCSRDVVAGQKYCSLKNDPRPHPDEDQSSKRAKIDEDQITEDGMEAEQSPELGSLEQPVYP